MPERYLLHVAVARQMQLAGLEAVLTFAFIKNIRLEFVARTRRLLRRRHVVVLSARGAVPPAGSMVAHSPLSRSGARHE